MCVINFIDTQKHIVTLTVSLTFGPPYLINIVKLHMLLTMWASKFHGQCQRSHLTFWANISHYSDYPPYLTETLNLLISLSVCTLIYPLLSWLAHWLCDSVNAVRYPTEDTIFPSQPPHQFSGPHSSLSVEYRQFTFSGNAAKLYSWLTSV